MTGLSEQCYYCLLQNKKKYIDIQLGWRADKGWQIEVLWNVMQFWILDLAVQTL